MQLRGPRRVDGVGRVTSDSAQAKACVFDDATLLTGANLSEEYFRSRQDRYVVVRDHKVADWYDQAVRAAAAARTA